MQFDLVKYVGGEDGWLVYDRKAACDMTIAELRSTLRWNVKTDDELELEASWIWDMERNCYEPGQPIQTFHELVKEVRCEHDKQQRHLWHHLKRKLAATS